MKEEIVELTKLIGLTTEPRLIREGGIPFLVVPNDQKIVGCEHMLNKPVRKRGSVVFSRLESFKRYVNEHATDGTKIFWSGESFIAWLDHHTQEEAGCREHSATLQPKFSAQWQTWTKLDGLNQSQSDFAEFIEDNRADISAPSAGELLDIVRELEAVRDVTFKGALKKDNTVQSVSYEDNSLTKAKGNIELPTAITLTIPLYDGQSAESITCRLKATLTDGRLLLQYKMLQPKARIADAVENMVEEIARSTNIVPMFGYQA